MTTTVILLIVCVSPTPRVTWTRLDSPTSRHQVTREGHGTEIEFTNVQYNDAGTYRCSASNNDDPPTVYEDLVLVVECVLTRLTIEFDSNVTLT